jgi:hypothetical protein
MMRRDGAPQLKEPGPKGDYPKHKNYIQKIRGENGTSAGLDIVEGTHVPLVEIGIEGEKAFYPKSNRLQ